MKVKACPFCGGSPRVELGSRAIINGNSTKACFVRCSFCNARSGRVDLKDYGVTSQSKQAFEDVIKRWNKRAESERSEREYEIEYR